MCQPSFPSAAYDQWKTTPPKEPEGRCPECARRELNAAFRGICEDQGIASWRVEEFIRAHDPGSIADSQAVSDAGCDPPTCERHTVRLDDERR